MRLYKMENIDNVNICTIAANPKEYFEKLKNRSINKTHKGVRRDTPGMHCESFAERIKVATEIDSKLVKKISSKTVASYKHADENDKCT